MSEIVVLNEVDSLGVLVVDDDPTVGKNIRECFDGIKEVKTVVEQIQKPEEIKSTGIAEQEFSLIILDVVFQKEQKKIAYLLREVKKRWPDAVTIILSHYVGLLSKKQNVAADLVIGKTFFDLQPEIFINELTELVDNEKVGNSRILSIAVKEFEKQADLNKEKKLFNMTGYVIGVKGQYVEAVVPEKSFDGSKWRNLMIRSTLFTEKGLEGSGTPFVLQMFQAGSQIITEVDLNHDADEPAHIPDSIDKLISLRDEQDEQLRKEHANDK